MNDKLYMEINLLQLKENINIIKNTANKDLIVIVKSNAYGLGDVKVSKYLEQIGIKYIAVVDIFEAISLCEAGIKTNILILNSIEDSYYSYLEKYPNLIVTINNLDDCKNLINNYHNNLRVHLQIDTGMNRLGFKSIDDVKIVIDMFKNFNNFCIEGLYTHITDEDNLTIQENKFREYINLYDFKIIHLAASSSYKYSQVGNYVRVGLDVYGDSSLNGNKQIVKVIAKPIAINNVAKGDTIGYNRTYYANSEIRIAILPIGYYNGYLRGLKGFKVLANGKTYNVVGNICMNHIFVNVDEEVDLNTEFIITSDELSIYEISKYLNTITHEVLCMFNIKEKVYIE